VVVEQRRDTLAWPAAKVTPPRPRALVSRQRLLCPLNGAVVAGRVTLVVAPGGSGKTSLLADWARQAPLPVAWYALDAADQDTRRLAYGLCAAVERALPGVAHAARAALDGGGAEAAAIGLLLGALEGQPLALVLDDFQYLDDVPEAVALWDHLLRFRPPSLALIILSRSVPLLGFAALAAMDELMGLGRDELCFDAAEGGKLLAAHGLDAGSAVQFAARSGGWAAGMLLLGHAGPGGVRFLRARTEALMEHLGSEVLAALPHELRRFLVESAALGPASPEDADAVLERRDSAALYAEAAARGLFLERDDGGLYRYHDLFAEYLAGALRAEDPGRLRAVRRAAAARFAAHGDVPRALGLLAAEEDWEALAATIEREKDALWLHGLWGTVLTHIEHLPPAYHTPRLLALCGHARAQRGEFAEAVALADAGMAASGDDQDNWLVAAILRAEALLLAGRFVEAGRAAEAALDVARQVEHVVALTRLRELRGEALLRTGFLDEGRADMLAALGAFEEARDTHGEARVLFNLATQLILAGYARDAETYLVRAEALWRRAGNKAMLGNVHNTRALLHLLGGDYAAARAEVEQALALARKVGYPLLECWATATLAEVCADAGSAAEAERYALAAQEMAGRLDLVDALNDALRARIAAALIRRDRAGARLLIDEARLLVVAPVDEALLDLYEGTLALRSRAHTRASDVLGLAAARLEGLNRPHQAARAHLLQAEALLAAGSERRATAALNRAAELAGPAGCEGYLLAAARMARQALDRRRALRRLRREARLLLDSLAASTTPALALVPTPGEEEAEPATLHVSPFGQGRLTLAGDRLEEATLPPKARELVFYAAHAGRPLRRDELIETLWDGELRAAQALWDASRHLRHLLGEDSWGPRGGAYMLRLAVEDDGRRFDELVDVALGTGSVAGRLDAGERALEVIGEGGYLEWCEGLWALTERTRVAGRATAVALALAGLYEGLGRSEDALAACRRAARFDPLDEAPRLTLLRLLAVAGRLEEAMREYKAYRRLLRDELAAEPSPALRALVKVLARQS